MHSDACLDGEVYRRKYPAVIYGHFKLLLYNSCVSEPNGRTATKLPKWAIIVIAVMSGLVLLTALVVLLVFAFTWFNRYRSAFTFKSYKTVMC